MCTILDERLTRKFKTLGHTLIEGRKIVLSFYGTTRLKSYYVPYVPDYTYGWNKAVGKLCTRRNRATVGRGAFHVYTGRSDYRETLVGQHKSYLSVRRIEDEYDCCRAVVPVFFYADEVVATDMCINDVVAVPRIYIPYDADDLVCEVEDESCG